MKVNVFETSELSFKAKVKRAGLGKKKQDIKARFTFQQTGGSEKVQDALVVVPNTTGSEITHEVPLPKVKDDEVNYALTYCIATDDDATNGFYEYVVWPRTYTVKTTNKDGKPVPHVPMGVGIAAMTVDKIRTDDKGEASYVAKMTGEMTLHVYSPFILENAEDFAKQKGRARTAVVSKRSYTARIRSPDLAAGEKCPSADHGHAADKAVKQWVNVEPKDGTNRGSRVKVTIGAVDDGLTVAGDKFFVQVHFDPKNCKRNVPKSMFWLNGAGYEPQGGVVKSELPVKENDGTVSFELELGVAGGDKYTIKAGVTEKCEDDEITIETWRAVGMGMITLEKAHRQSCSSLVADDKPELGPGLQGKLDGILDKLFLKLGYPADLAVEFKLADIDGLKFDAEAAAGLAFSGVEAKGAHTVIDGAVFANWVQNPVSKAWSKPALAGKLFAPPAALLDKIKEKVLAGKTHPKNTLDVRWCDFLAARETSTDFLAAPRYANFIVHEFTAAHPNPKNFHALPFHVFAVDPVRADGSKGVRAIEWRIKAIRKSGVAAWSAPTAADPEFDKHAWQAAPSATDAEIARYVRFNDSRDCDVMLPATNAGDPGKLLTIVRAEPAGGGGVVDVTYRTQIEVRIWVYGVHFNILGSAFGGFINMTTQGAKATDQGCAEVIVHELGHNLGQSYMQNLGPGELHDAPPGSDDRGRALAHEIPGIPFAKVVPDGPMFAGKGYSGGHCAAGIKAKVDAGLPGAGKAAERKAVFDEPNWGKPSAAHKQYFNVPHEKHCIMFATTDPTTAKARSFCADCTQYIIATDASDIQKDWRK